MRRKRRPCLLGCGMVASKTRWGKVLRDRRLELRMTQEEVALKARILQRRVSAAETGETRYLKKDIVQPLAKALRLKPEYLFQIGVRR